MPGYVIHIAQAYRILDILGEVRKLSPAWREAFVTGNLLPDTRLKAEKGISHFWNPGDQDKIAKAPDQMRDRLLWLIARERENAENGVPARILAKMNSLSDKKIIKALIKASQAGVEIDLIVRGICCIVPEVEGITENVHVRSIVGRHLEHARAFLFENGGNHEVYLASADWMPRNLSRRAELMFPVKDPACRQAIENVLTLQWNDTQKCRHRNPDGSDELVPLREGGLNAQEVLLANIRGVFEGTVPLQLEMQESAEDAAE